MAVIQQYKPTACIINKICMTRIDLSDIKTVCFTVIMFLVKQQNITGGKASE